MNKPPKSKRINLKWIKIFFINIGIFFLLILLFETITFFVGVKILKKGNIGFIRYDKDTRFKDPCYEMISHPFYGYTHKNSGDCKIEGVDKIENGFVYYSDIKPADSIIVTLGSSTTDGFYYKISNSKTWPKLLQEKLILEGYNYKVVNGGLGGTTSSQDLLKLLLDVRKMKNPIKSIISFNGACEVEGYNMYEEIYMDFPFWNTTIFDMFSNKKYINQEVPKWSLYFPNIQRTLRFILSNGKKKKFDSDFYNSIKTSKTSEISNLMNWEFNISVMNNISQEIGSKYYVFLQPTMGLENTQIPNMKVNSNDTKIYEDALLKDESNYFSRINELYQNLRNTCFEKDYCFDISNIAPPTGNNYSDLRHHNENGNKLISEAIFNILVKEN